MRLAVDPSDIRSTLLERGRPFALPLKAGLGAACMFAMVTGSIWFLPASTPRSGDVRLAKVGDWPEIKDGVPEVARPAPAPVAEAASVAPALEPLPTAMFTPASGPPTPAKPATVATQPAAKPQKIVAAAPAPAPVEVPRPPVRSAAFAPTAPAGEAARVVTPVPMPPPRVAQRPVAEQAREVASREMSAREQAAPAKEATAAKEAVQPARDAAAPPRRPVAKPAPVKQAAKNATQTASKGEPAEAEQNDNAKVFGVQLPGVPSGRKIKESMQSLGDAVLNLPSRL